MSIASCAGLEKFEASLSVGPFLASTAAIDGAQAADQGSAADRAQLRPTEAGTVVRPKDR